MRSGDLEGKWYAHFWAPEMAPLPDHVRHAVLLGPQAWPLCLRLDDAPSLTAPGYQELENGFSFSPEGAVHVAVLTHLPSVSPAMWDWWFGWHSAETQRYKLWHPRAHLYSEWSAPDKSPST